MGSGFLGTGKPLGFLTPDVPKPGFRVPGNGNPNSLSNPIRTYLAITRSKVDLPIEMKNNITIKSNKT
jgi:hypothetical protein